MPEPRPEKHRDDDAEGTRPAGQEDDGNATHKPPAAPTAETTATERRAKEPRPAPKEEAAKTAAPGNTPRKKLSTPRAQPTNTREADGTAAAATEQPLGTEEREPEKPKAENREKTEETTTLPKKLYS
ncbi:hypothetical protein [Aphanizomenon flos-aquae]|uniref:hypothetical protein n=1 Tax=Aphanizomenon flos-aquae TaxID=1176 RepID=UPI0004891140|nr:hypothetical protein [Aphanizomenon flos-aquae]